MSCSRRLSLASALALLAVAAATPSATAASTDPGCPTAAERGLAGAGDRESTYRLARTSDDPLLGTQWALTAAATTGAGIDAPAAWDVTTGSRAVTVAVIDTGIDLTSGALTPNVAVNAGESGDGREANGVDDDLNGYVDDWHGWDFDGRDNDPQDLNGHGTHVAGIVGAVGNDGLDVAGVAWTVGLLPLQVIAADGTGSSLAVAEAMDYAVRRGARIVNLSLGGSGTSDAMLRAICAAPETLFVVAAGNTGADVDAVPYYPCAYPPANVVCVAASDEDGLLAAFSGFGATDVDLAAPGADIVGLGLAGGTAVFSGTSMAAPHVSGVAALVLTLHPEWSAAQVKDVLLATVVVRADLAGRLVSGGRLDAGRAVLGVTTPATATGAALAPRTVQRVRRFLSVGVRVPAAGRVSIVVTRAGTGGRIAVATASFRVGRAGVKRFRMRITAAGSPVIRLAAGRHLGVSVRLTASGATR